MSYSFNQAYIHDANHLTYFNFDDLSKVIRLFRCLYSRPYRLLFLVL